METMSFNVVLLGAIPESILILLAGLLLLGVKPEMKKVIFVGVIQGITIYFIRKYFEFGMHMVLSFTTIVIYTYMVMRIYLPTVIISMILSFAVVILVEGPVLILLKGSISYIFSVEWIRLALFIPQDIALLLIIYFCSTKQISLSQEFHFLNKLIK